MSDPKTPKLCNFEPNWILRGRKESIEKALEIAAWTKEDRAAWNNRHQTWMQTKFDCTAFLTWFIENYPDSERLLDAANTRNDEDAWIDDNGHWQWPEKVKDEEGRFCIEKLAPGDSHPVQNKQHAFALFSALLKDKDELTVTPESWRQSKLMRHHILLKAWECGLLHAEYILQPGHNLQHIDEPLFHSTNFLNESSIAGGRVWNKD